MVTGFRTIATTGFKRDVSRITRRNSRLLVSITEVLTVLERDPYNFSRKHDIAKLVGVKPREGLWRIRAGNYRIRYDIIDRDVVLYIGLPYH